MNAPSPAVAYAGLSAGMISMSMETVSTETMGSRRGGVQRSHGPATTAPTMRSLPLLLARYMRLSAASTIASTVVGAGLWLVTSPFSLLGSNVGEAGEVLVLNPGKNTFVRCLGCPPAQHEPLKA